MSANNVVELKDYQPPPPRIQSQYELYPLPFFNAVGTGCTWDVKPTGNYGDDCDTGRAYAIAFLKSCDRTIGWSTLLAKIVSDMNRAGPRGASPTGRPYIDGVAVGFMCEIGRALSGTGR